jgi:hypothetical protein
MKHIITLLFLILISQLSFSQITTSSTAKPEETKPIYTGEVNFLGKEVDGYIGQQLYLMPQSESLRKYGYDNFIINYNEEGLTYKQKQKNIYEKQQDGYNSKYDALQGKYFDVLDVIKEGYYKIFIKLRETESSDVLYYEYSERFEHSFPFLVVAYFENCNKKYVGNKVITRGNHLTKGWSSNEPMNDVITGEIIPFDPGIVWNVESLTIEDKYYNFVAKVVNEDGHTVYISVDKLNESPNSKYVFLYSDVSKYLGTEEWDLILNNKIKVGITEEVAKLSWGEPESINRSTSGDQWVYDNQYLYFENGKLTSWN